MQRRTQAPDAQQISVVLTVVALGASACGLAWVLVSAFVPLLASGS